MWSLICPCRCWYIDAMNMNTVLVACVFQGVNPVRAAMGKVAKIITAITLHIREVVPKMTLFIHKQSIYHNWTSY